MLRFLLHFIIAISLIGLFQAPPVAAGNTATSEQEVALDAYPSPIDGIQIKYPESALKAEKQGKVLLEVRINEKGMVTQVTVVESQGKDLDAAAENAVRSTKWNPGMAKGKPVACSVRVPIDFKLKDKVKK